MDLIASLFEKSGKKTEDLEKLAAEILSLSQVNPTYERGQRLIDMSNYLEQEVFGPSHVDKETHSDARQLIEEERKLLHKDMQPWIFSATFSKEDLLLWLKRYYALEYYAKHFELADEIYEILSGKAKKTSTQH